MTKVEHTRTHKITIPRFNPDDCSVLNVLVTDAELVLVGKNQCDGCCAGKPIQDGMHRMGDGQYPDYMICKKADYVKPILISRTEKIEVGDWGYNKTHGLVKVTNLLWAQQEGLFKVVALPEHFSPEHLQDIVDGKLKGKVVVECEMKDNKSQHIAIRDYFAVIKLNSSGYVTIYPVVEETLTYQQWIDKYRDQLFGIPKEKIGTNPKIQVEEKMYTREEVSTLLDKLFWWKHYNPTKEDNDFLEWFEQNVK